MLKRWKECDIPSRSNSEVTSGTEVECPGKPEAVMVTLISSRAKRSICWGVRGKGRYRAGMGVDSCGAMPVTKAVNRLFAVSRSQGGGAIMKRQGAGGNSSAWREEETQDCSMGGVSSSVEKVATLDREKERLDVEG